MKLTEEEAKRLILANGYVIERESDQRVAVRNPKRRRHAGAIFVGMNWRDLAGSFMLHKRPAR